ncbi:MAG TPA: hypothetical protein VLX92_06760 [Kofleriaceae bacterium]|nr:hypothetical protein [Kofleriaceae bacterium]
MRAGAVLVLAVMVGLAAPTRAGNDGYKVIVNPKNPITAIDRDFLRNAFLKKVSEWSDGLTIRPIDLSAQFPARARFTREVLRKSANQLRSYWNQQIFSGKGVPPPEAGSTADLVTYVLDHPGAVGYLPSDADPGRAKVVEVQ